MAVDAPRWLIAKEIVGDALERPVSERAALIEARCGGDEGLLSEVKAYLAAASDTADFLAPIERLLHAAPTAADHAGRRLGAYRLLREIGRGGMSVVYIAERADGAYEQHVAVKLMQSSNSADAPKRVARERQALATLDHPNIARLIDGGIAPDGMAYLVMDYVDGTRIDDWCQQNNRSLKQRVTLMIAVCEAVQHAHQQLIVHRDIKPANILVNQQGTPKLLDFGVARLLETASEQTDVTQAGALLFTPRYASPEQVKGLPANVSADVYGLGMLLYELLAGSSPFVRISSNQATSAAAAMQAVLEDECRKASKVAADYQPAHVELLKGDLDTILAKACARDPGERYQTVAELKDDLAAWCESRPIHATKPTWAYLTQKFLARHKLGSAAGAVGLLLLAGSAVLIVQKSNEANRERALAERRFDDVRKLAGKALFDYYDDVEKLPNSLALREKIARDSTQYLDSLSAEAGDNLSLLQDLASGYERLGAIYGRTWASNAGKPELARQYLDQALAMRERIYKLDPISFANAAAIASTLQERADVEIGSGKVDDAVKLIDRGIAVLEPQIKREGVTKSTPASYTLSKLYRMRAAVDSCAGSNTRGRSGEAVSLLRAKTPFMESFAATHPDKAFGAGELAAFQTEIGTAASCRGEFDVSLTALARAREAYVQLRQQYPDATSYPALIALIDIEIATTKWQAGDYAQSADLAVSAFEKMAPMAAQAPDDIGLQLRSLVVAVKASNFLLKSSREVDLRNATRTLEFSRKLSNDLLAKMPTNGFARVLANAAAGAQNVLDAKQGRVAEAITRQRALIERATAGAPSTNVLAQASVARMYSNLARMYPPTEATSICTALSGARSRYRALLAVDRSSLRDAISFVDDIGLSRSLGLAPPCASTADVDEARALAKEIEARGVKHVELPKLVAALR